MEIVDLKIKLIHSKRGSASNIQVNTECKQNNVTDINITLDKNRQECNNLKNGLNNNITNINIETNC